MVLVHVALAEVGVELSVLLLLGVQFLKCLLVLELLLLGHEQLLVLLFPVRVGPDRSDLLLRLLALLSIKEVAEVLVRLPPVFVALVNDLQA